MHWQEKTVWIELWNGNWRKCRSCIEYISCPSNAHIIYGTYVMVHDQIRISYDCKKLQSESLLWIKYDCYNFASSSSFNQIQSGTKPEIYIGINLMCCTCLIFIWEKNQRAVIFIRKNRYCYSFINYSLLFYVWLYWTVLISRAYCDMRSIIA